MQRTSFALVLGTAAALALAQPAAAGAPSVVLYANDFETPNQPIVSNCGNSLDITGRGAALEGPESLPWTPPLFKAKGGDPIVE